MIRLEHVAKCFPLRHERRLLPRVLTGRRTAVHWALLDVTLHVEQGQSLALLGVNGCGKTTLLRLISGVTTPSLGKLRVAGRVGGLIELGAGFHPDLTGMENIFLNGTLLGMSRREIKAKLEEILDFAELGDFIHTRVRHYSWGMFLRLGFSVAVAAEPDILVIDEALAVGDGYFQWKCFRRIDQIKKQGGTLVFVSHLPNVAESVCTHAAWIHEGMVRAYGHSHDVAAGYAAFVRGLVDGDAPRQASGELGAFVPHARIGSGEVLISGVRLEDANGNPRQVFTSESPMSILMDVTAARPTPDVCVGVTIERANQPVTDIYSVERGRSFDVPAGPSRIRVTFPKLLLHRGDYYMTLTLLPSDDLVTPYDGHIKRYSFSVTDSGSAPYSPRFLRMPVAAEWHAE